MIIHSLVCWCINSQLGCVEVFRSATDLCLSTHRGHLSVYSVGDLTWPCPCKVLIGWSNSCGNPPSPTCMFVVETEGLYFFILSPLCDSSAFLFHVVWTTYFLLRIRSKKLFIELSFFIPCLCSLSSLCYFCLNSHLCKSQSTRSLPAF